MLHKRIKLGPKTPLARYPMTWGEFKASVESSGVIDSDLVYSIDVGAVAGKIYVSIDEFSKFNGDSFRSVEVSDSRILVEKPEN